MGTRLYKSMADYATQYACILDAFPLDHVLSYKHFAQLMGYCEICKEFLTSIGISAFIFKFCILETRKFPRNAVTLAAHKELRTREDLAIKVQCVASEVSELATKITGVNISMGLSQCHTSRHIGAIFGCRIRILGQCVCVFFWMLFGADML